MFIRREGQGINVGWDTPSVEERKGPAPGLFVFGRVYYLTQALNDSRAGFLDIQVDDYGLPGRQQSEGSID